MAKEKLQKSVNKKLKSFVIDRSKWQRFSPKVLKLIESLDCKDVVKICKFLPSVSESFLFDPENSRMCCLGFCCIASNIAKKSIEKHSAPCEIGKNNFKKIPFLLADNVNFIDDSDLANDLMNINDDFEISDKQKESKIIKIFSKIGIKVKFIGPSIEEEIKTVKQKIKTKKK